MRDFKRECFAPLDMFTKSGCTRYIYSYWIGNAVGCSRELIYYVNMNYRNTQRR